MSFKRMLSLMLSLGGTRIIGAALGLMIQILLARTMSAEQVGAYFLMVSCATFSSLILSLGYPELALTALARFHALKRTSLAKAFVVAARRDILSLSLVLIPAGLLAVHFLPQDGITSQALTFGILAGPSSMILRFNGYAAMTVKRFVLAYVPDFIIKSAALLVFFIFWILFVGNLTLSVVFIAFLVVNYAIAIAQSIALGKLSLPGSLKRPRKRLHRGLWRQRAISLMVVAFVTFAFSDIATLLAAMFLSKAELAVFAIAIRLAAIMNFFAQAAQQFIVRDVTDALVAGDEKQANGVLLRINIAAMSIICLAIIVTALFGNYLLLVFGPQMVAGHWMLVMLLFAGLVRAGSGMNAHLLSLGGHQRRLASNAIIVLVIMFTMATLLAPLYGAMGVVIAVITAELALSVVYAVMAQKLTGRRGDLIATLCNWHKRTA